MAKEIIYTTKRYIGTKTPVLGIPLAFLGIMDDTVHEKLTYEVCFFLEGITKFYAHEEFEYPYGNIDAEYREDHKAIAYEIVEAQIEKILFHAMDQNKIPRQLYKEMKEISEDECKIHLQSLKYRGTYDDEIDNIARNSNCFKMEFSDVLRLPLVPLKAK